MDAPRALCDFKGALYEPEKWPRGRKMGPEGACPGFLDMGWLREGKGWGGGTRTPREFSHLQFFRSRVHVR